MRSFISYCRSDRQRILGLASLLEAFDHNVFVDERSIKAGKEWREELFVQLENAEVLIVFWTRAASSSSWVRREFEYFNRRFPERLLIPITGDRTPLPPDLEGRQSVSLFPLINELFDIVSDLRTNGASQRKIRAVILKRLREEGIDLAARSRRNRILALFGVSSLMLSPLIFSQSIWDDAIDRISRLPISHFFVGGSAAVASVFVCHEISDSSINPLLIPDLHQVPVRVGQSGTDACEARDLICVSIARATIFDRNDRFVGYSTPTCSSRIVERSWCRHDFQTQYAYEGVVIRKSLDADPNAEEVSGNHFFCLNDEQGRSGVYEFANCVEP